MSIIYAIKHLSDKGIYWNSWLKWANYIDIYIQQLSDHYKGLRKNIHEWRISNYYRDFAFRCVDLFKSHGFSRSCKFIVWNISLALLCMHTGFMPVLISPDMVIYAANMLLLTYATYRRMLDMREYQNEQRDLRLLEELKKLQNTNTEYIDVKPNWLKSMTSVLISITPGDIFNICLAYYRQNLWGLYMSTINFILSGSAYTILSYNHQVELHTYKQHNGLRTDLTGTQLQKYIATMKQDLEQKNYMPAYQKQSLAREIIDTIIGTFDWTSRINSSHNLLAHAKSM